ncbi:cell envelope biogenesis protein TolA [Variovorax ginsengisoli]|uniref:Cell envelope biogenesis protein TolA n=1 Tax=Variovorax ginsengisoli TaxID=363844 RepID=A0ABT9S6M7_9BURK|nr:cell envelope biogenesis protein TolA [Variovorax ginsengisoli]MDP9898967.1 hypothetical protein [Variovorax ginsengisoli]
MNKVLAVMIAGLFAAGAYAQNPTGKTPEQGALPSGKAVDKAEAKVASRPAGVAPAAGGDINKTPEGGAVGVDKAAVAGQKRASTRDARHLNKDGSVKKKTVQGGTPK